MERGKVDSSVHDQRGIVRGYVKYNNEVTSDMPVETNGR